MLSSLPFVLILTQTVGGHAVLHPSDANLYLELPDLPGMLAAYEDAPLVKLLADPELGRFVAGFAGEDPETFRLDRVVRDAIADGIEGLPLEAQHALELLQSAEAVSLSLGSGDVLAVARDLAEGVISEEEFGFIMLEEVGALIVVEFSDADSAVAAEELLTTAIASAHTGLIKSARTRSLLGTECEVHDYALGTEDTAQVLFWTGASAGKLLIGFGRSTPEELSSRADHPQAALQGDAGFQRGRAAFRVEHGAAIYECFFRLEGMTELVMLGMFEEAAEDRALVRAILEHLLPADRVETHSITRLVGGRFVSESLESTAAGDPGPVCCTGPVGPDSFDMIPADAVGLWVTNIDPAALRREVTTLLAGLTGQDAATLFAEAQAKWGLDPEDVFGSLGERMAFYCLPLSGLTLPKVHVALELKDPAAFERGVDGLGAIVAELTEGEVKVDSKPYRKTPVICLAPKKGLGEMASASGGPPQLAMLAPAFLDPQLSIAVLPDRAVLGISPTYVKREIKRLLGDADSARHPLASSAGAFPADAVAVGYADWGALIGGVYNAARSFLPMVAQMAGPEFPFDPTDLPEAELITKHFQPSISWRRRVEGGLYAYSESSFGPEIALALIGAGVGGALAIRTMSEAEDPMIIEVDPPEEPVLGDAVEEKPAAGDEAERTRAALMDVKLALVVYHGDQGRYPATLDALLLPTASFPQGFLGGEALPADGWGRALRYRPGADGGDFALWSKGPDGVDQDGAGDDLVAR